MGLIATIAIALIVAWIIVNNLELILWLLGSIIGFIIFIGAVACLIKT